MEVNTCLLREISLRKKKLHRADYMISSLSLRCVLYSFVCLWRDVCRAQHFDSKIRDWMKKKNICLCSMLYNSEVCWSEKWWLQYRSSLCIVFWSDSSENTIGDCWLAGRTCRSSGISLLTGDVHDVVEGSAVFLEHYFDITFPRCIEIYKPVVEMKSVCVCAT